MAFPADILHPDFALLLDEVELLGPVRGGSQVREHLGDGHHAFRRPVVVLVLGNVLRHQDRVLAHGPEAVRHLSGAVGSHGGKIP
jgi:hypothetical protein